MVCLGEAQVGCTGIAWTRPPNGNRRAKGRHDQQSSPSHYSITTLPHFHRLGLGYAPLDAALRVGSYIEHDQGIGLSPLGLAGSPAGGSGERSVSMSACTHICLCYQ